MPRHLDINTYPKACITGLKGGLLAFIVAIVGHSLNYFLGFKIGYWVALAGVLGGFVSAAIFYKGFLFDRNDKTP